MLTSPGRSVLNAVAESHDSFEISVNNVIRIVRQIFVVIFWQLRAPRQERIIRTLKQSSYRTLCTIRKGENKKASLVFTQSNIGNIIALYIKASKHFFKYPGLT